MSGPKTGPRRVARSLVGLLLLLGGGSPTSRAEDPQLARAFEVRYRELADAADLVSPLLSADGTLTLRPRLRTLIVEDRQAVLERVGALLQSWDLPPRNAEITLSLFLGTDRRSNTSAQPAAGSELSREVRGILETLADFTKWTAYEPLGSRSITGTEGDEVVAQLSPEYRVAFILESVHPEQGVITFRWFTLQRVRQDEDGSERIQDLYKTGMVLTAGKLHVVGAASDPDSKRALFLTLQARPR